MLVPAFTYNQLTSISSGVIDHGKSVFTVYILNATELLEIEAFIKSIYESNPTPFCVMLRLGQDSGVSEQKFLAVVSEPLIAIMFHPAYIQMEPDVAFLFTDGLSDDVMRELGIVITSQGYKSVDYRNIGDAGVHRLSTDEKFEGHYLDVLLNTGLTDCIVFEKGDVSVNSVPSRAEAVEAELSKTFPRRYEILTQAKKLRDGFTELLFTHDLAEEQLESLTGYALSNKRSGYGSRQAAEVAEFYKYEYEILPGWFKKLGHIIKVVTGKRTFRSLFNDNVKKYKQ